MGVRTLICGATLAVTFGVFACPTWASRDGVDYVIDSMAIVYGGSYLWQRTQNPEDARILYAERLSTFNRDVLYRGEGVISEIKAQPNGSLIAVIERIWQENVSPDRATYVGRRVGEDGELQEFYYFEESRLHILNLNGVILDTVKGVRRFAWEPSGNRIAYITGDYYEGGLGFVTTGTWIYELGSTQAQAQRIFSGGVAVQWRTWDGNVYIYDPFYDTAGETVVFRFDPDVQRLTSTTHHGIFFSPDGRYYYAESEGIELRVYRTDTDTLVPLDLSIAGDQTRVAYRAGGWIGAATLIVPSPIPTERADYLYDIDTKMARFAAGTIIPAGESSNRILVLEGDSFTERNLNEFLLVQ